MFFVHVFLAVCERFEEAVGVLLGGERRGFGRRFKRRLRRREPRRHGGRRGTCRRGRGGGEDDAYERIAAGYGALEVSVEVCIAWFIQAPAGPIRI